MSKDWSEFDRLTDEYLAKPLPTKWSIRELAEVVSKSLNNSWGDVVVDTQLTSYLEIYKID